MNPEFRRNLILELSVQRLIAMPVILFLIYTLAGLTRQPEVAVAAAKFIMVGLAVVWGARLAADSVLGEVNARTWDGQRMSALGPFTLSWGKLFGSTIFTWYGVAISAPVLLYWSDYDTELVAKFILLGLFSQSVAFLAGLVILRSRPQRLRFQVTLAHLIGLAAAAFFWSLINSANNYLTWYGYAISGPEFAFVSATLFLCWSWLGTYRLMRAELQFRCWPWIWPLFVLYCAVYIAGFSFSKLTDINVFLLDAPGVQPILRVLAGFVTAAGLTWIAAYVEPKGFVSLRRWALALRGGSKGRLFETTPVWAPSMAITVVLGLALVAMWLSYYEARNIIEGVADLESVGAFAFAVLLFLSRDIGLIHFLTLDGRSRRAHLTALVYLAVLYALLPLLLAAFDQDHLLPLLVPMAQGKPIVIILPVLVQVGIVAGLLAWRWRRVARVMVAAGWVRVWF